MKTLKNAVSIFLQLLAIASVFAIAYMFLILGYGAGMKM